MKSWDTPVNRKQKFFSLRDGVQSYNLTFSVFDREHVVRKRHLLLLVLLTYNITKNLVFLKIIPDFSQWVSWSLYHFPIFVQEREIVTSFQKFVRSFCTQVYLQKNMLLSELCMDDWNPIFWDNEFFTSI